MPNLYADLPMFRARFMNNGTLDAADQAEVMRVLEASSRRVDDHCRRSFFAQQATRHFDGAGHGRLLIPDLLEATSVKLDEDMDRVYELTLSGATDYYLVRDSYIDQDALPKTAIMLDPWNGPRTSFQHTPRLLEISGTWGFTQATEPTGATTSFADASVTSMTVSVADAVAAGQTLLIEAEQVYVSGGAGVTYTVQRGVNGTAAAAHGAGALARYVYVPEVREAALITAGRLWARRQTSYSNVIANPVVGQFEVFKQLDPDVVELLWPFVRREAR